jgi:AcrR family transcriptional regulator
MARPIGAVGKAHQARRLEILSRLTERLTRTDAMHASYRELAASAGVSLSTLQHYFGRREEIVKAVLQQAQVNAAPHFERLAEPEASLEATVTAALFQVRMGFEHFGVGEIHALALVEGLRNAAIGPVTVDSVLEPSIEAMATCLKAHQERGEMRPDVAPRHAAIMLLAPPILILLHQNELHGAHKHPVELEAFLEAHASSFLRAHQVDQAA